MNLNVSWPDPDAIHGSKQTVAVNWLAATSSERGTVYYRKKGTRRFERVIASGMTFGQALSEARAALEHARWRRDDAARALGMSRTTLWRKMKEYRL